MEVTFGYGDMAGVGRKITIKDEIDVSFYL